MATRNELKASVPNKQTGSLAERLETPEKLKCLCDKKAGLMERAYFCGASANLSRWLTHRARHSHTQQRHTHTHIHTHTTQLICPTRPHTLLFTHAQQGPTHLIAHMRSKGFPCAHVVCFDHKDTKSSRAASAGEGTQGRIVFIRQHKDPHAYGRLQRHRTTCMTSPGIGLCLYRQVGP